MPQKSRSRQGAGKNTNKPRKRKNPNRRKGGQQAWETRRKKYGPTGLPAEVRKRRGEKKGAAKKKAPKTAPRKRRGEAKAPKTEAPKKKKKKKRRGQPYEGSALQKYNLSRAAKRSASGLSREEILRKRQERKLAKKRARAGGGAPQLSPPVAAAQPARSAYFEQLRAQFDRDRAEREAREAAKFN